MGKKKNKRILKKAKKKLKPDLLTYVRTLDRLRWEFLRLSDRYRADWRQYWENYYFENELYRRFCPDCEIEGSDCSSCEHLSGLCLDEFVNDHRITPTWNWTVDGYYQDLGQAAINVMMKYGIRGLPNPDDPYEEVMYDLGYHDIDNDSKARGFHKVIFYTYLHEYGIYEGIYPHVDLENSPFMTLTINLTAHEDIVDSFRTLLRQRKKQLYRKEDKKLLRKKWSLPQNVHFDVLEKALETLRYSQGGMSHAEIAKKLYKTKEGVDHDQRIKNISDFLDEKRVSGPVRIKLQEKYLHSADKDFEKYEYQVENYLRKARAILQNVEQGIFP